MDLAIFKDKLNVQAFNYENPSIYHMDLAFLRDKLNVQAFTYEDLC